MRLDDLRSSRNVEDQRGRRRGRAGGKLTLGGVAAAALLVFVFKVDPQTAMQIGGLTGGIETPAATAPGNDAGAQFTAKVLGSTEDVWARILPAQAGLDYATPKLVLFSGMVQSGCGTAEAAMGPFYCPTDQKVYIDLDFFNDLAGQLGAKGDFAQAYVIAHEVGHHVENLQGILAKAHAAKARSSTKAANAISVKTELLADCYAGVWAHHAQAMFHVLEPGDLEEALTAASAVGDDRLQQQAQGTVVPDSFTHGTSAQRVTAFKQGFNAGQMDDCGA